jgi:hypothetical protein
MKQEHKELKEYKEPKDYNIDELMKFADNICSLAAGLDKELGLECRNNIPMILIILMIFNKG